MEMRAVVAILLAGCIGEAPSSQSPPPPPPPDAPSPTPAWGVVVQPRLGQLVDGDPQRALVSVVGVANRPSYAISIQVPDRPDSFATWVTVASTATAAQPSATDASMYEWATAIAPAALDPARWPIGGVLRVRAVGGDGEVLAVLFDDADGCIANNSGWRERAVRCGAQLDHGAAIVSTAATPIEVGGRPRFLDLRGVTEATETSAYYQAIGAPATLSAFRTVYNFAAGETTSVYYNDSDLGIGRGMHCTATSAGGLACYVSNYGTFGGDPDDAISRAVTGETAGGTGAFASVAMVYTPPASRPNAVTFMVYGATGALITSAQLDTFGDNTSIPNNCLNCHGAGATYDPIAHAATGAHFLPFDQASFRFSTQPGFTAGDQAPAVRALDDMVARTDVTAAILRISNDPDRVPAEWSSTIFDEAVYRNLVAPTCRGCHASLTGALAFESAADFRALSDGNITAICAPGHLMPAAEVPFRRTWTTSARAYLLAALDAPTACAP